MILDTLLMSNFRSLILYLIKIIFLITILFNSFYYKSASNLQNYWATAGLADKFFQFNYFLIFIIIVSENLNFF